MHELLVDSRLDIAYYAYLLKGFRDAALVRRISFKLLDAPRSSSSGVPMILRSEDRDVRLYLSTNDQATLDPAGLAWADVYGKVNLAPDAPPDPKIMALGPVFGIRFWSQPVCYAVAAKMWVGGARLRHQISRLRFQAIARLPLDRYVPQSSDDRYVFHASRPWSGKHAATNAPRERFLAACDALGIPVDGGFSDDRLTLDDYLERLGRSAVAFNCPAVHQCLGWKLGEYLALGKAIVSTPLTRRLPSPLVHGEHVHFVDDNVEAIAEGVERAVSDLEYRRHLEGNARRWFDEHLAPAVLARRLVEASR